MQETPKAAIVEAKPQEGDSYLSVYFEYEELYGIINQRGEVVELPQYYYSPSIHGNIIEEQSKGASIKRKEFRYVGQTEYL